MDLPERPGKYPILGITLAAMVGILLADFRPAASWIVILVLAAAFFFWTCFRRTPVLLIFVVAVFYTIHGLQFERNPGRQLASELGDRSITVRGTAVVDSVPQEIVSPNGKVRSSFQATEAILVVGEKQKIPPIKLLITWPNADVEIGDRIQFEGNCFKLVPPRNPGEFDYAAWLARRDIFNAVSVMIPKKAVVLERGKDWNLRRFANRSKNTLIGIITADLQQAPIEAGVISAMLLGAKDDTGDTIQELFQRTGTTHLFSVSGLHVSMLGAIAFFIFSTVRLPRRMALFLIIPTVFAYTLITGWSPSSVRAAIMTSVFVVATLLARPSLSINTLAVASFLILIGNTNQLFSAGFQLSFSVVAAIVLLSGPISRWLKSYTRPDPFIPRKLLTPVQKTRWLVAGKLCNALGLTLSAWLGSLALTAWYFSLLTPVALLANLVIVPMAFLVLILGVLAMIAAPISSWLVVAFNNVNWLWVKCLLLVLGGFSAIPLGSMFVGPHWWQRASEERITVFDLGSGGATVIETSGSCWLVDCGSEIDYRRTVRSYLQQRGINRVAGVFLTHGDSSHVGGITQLKADFPRAEIYLPKAGRKALVFRRLLKNESAHWMTSGDTISLSPEASIRVLWPPPEVDSGRADDHCLVLKLEVGGRRLLFTGDSGFPTEVNLLASDSPGELQTDWLISGRDRPDPGSSEDFLARTGAKMMLATAKKFPPSEQIPQSLVDSCEKLKINLLRFDRSGAVQIDIRPGKVEYKEFCKSD